MMTANQHPAQVGIIMGSQSDLEAMTPAAEMLTRLQVPHEVRIVSAHRTPKLMYDYAQNAHQRGLHVIIAGAGGAAHLPGMVASLTHLPVIGVPVKSRMLNGVDSLLSIAQMPGSVPVATMAINNAKNAAIFAARILALHDADLRDRLLQYTENVAQEVTAMHEVVLVFHEGANE